MKLKIFFFLASTVLLSSCSPAYFLYVQNNTNHPIEVFVELKNDKYRKVLEKRGLPKYKSTTSVSNLESSSHRYFKNNFYAKEDYNFTSDYNYHFTLESNLLVNVDPNNSLSIFPFKKVYYLQNGKKCTIVPEKEYDDCNFIKTTAPKLVDLIEVED